MICRAPHPACFVPWLLATAMCVLAPRVVAADPGAPLPPTLAGALAAVPADPAPPKLIDAWHFVISNENHPERFRTTLAEGGGLGGMFVGVGAEQNYLYAGWGRPDVLVLMDFDQVIVDVHELYRLFFLDAATPEAFLRLWAPAGAPRARALIEQHAPPGRKGELLYAYRYARPHVSGRLRTLAAWFRARKQPIFVTDASVYDYLAGMHRSGRVRALRGDLTAGGALRELGGLARRMGMAVRMVYVSNAEEYFTYGAGLRDNFTSLPFDDRSVVLRTYVASRTEFVYAVQGALDFNRWLSDKRAHRVSDLLHAGFKTARDGSILLGGPPQSVGARSVAQR